MSALVTLSHKLEVCWEHPSTRLRCRWDSTALQQTPATTHAISPHSKYAGCSILLGSAVMLPAPRPMGLGKGRHPKNPAQGQGQGRAKHLSAASKACSCLQVSSPRKAARDTCAAEGPGNHAGSPLAGQAGRDRHLQRAIQEACLSPDTQTGCYPPFPVQWGPALPIRLPVSPSPGRKETVTYGSHPGGLREGSLRRGSPAGQRQAAPRLHLPSELSPGCGPALGPGLRAQLEREGQRHTERSLS